LCESSTVCRGYLHGTSVTCVPVTPDLNALITKPFFCLYRYVQLDCMQISDATVPICPQTGTETTWTRGPTAMSNNNRRVEETGRRTKGEEFKPGRIFNWRRESVSKRYKNHKKGCDTVLFVFRKVKTKYQRSLLNLR
jgi:hypothetical protein